ncbi:hypothetical protein BUE80_DR004992 [Diplocarpon rosae]|nr:hypothetical protein BUE80_DR004992 [Diplocarpon rosae]
MAATLAVVRRLNPSLRGVDLGLVLWFVLCGSIHLLFEGYFMYNHHRMPQMTDFFGQLWKEYALSDSRYMASDPFVLCMESWTAVPPPKSPKPKPPTQSQLMFLPPQIFWGPLSFLTALLIVRSSPYRHPVQALVSTGQFYGDVLYYTTSLFDDRYNGVRHYRPEPYYFWFYFVFITGPGLWFRLCLWSSIKATASAFRVQQTVKGSKKIA